MPTTALDYHEATKHRFDRFARSLGRLDWATQPNPFRRFAGAPVVSLPHERVAGAAFLADLYDGSIASVPIDLPSVAELLRCSFGLSAWKSYGASRWALRVNPSSGNLHPTEAYLVWRRDVFHYVPDEHALERRATVAAEAWAPDDGFLVALTSIHWREAWKYGERAYRYCQHDAGHALGALRYAAALLGWGVAVLGEWSDGQVASLLGLDREADFAGAEREVPTLVALITSGPDVSRPEPAALVEAARRGSWRGTANRLSTGHVDWPLIDEVTAAATYPGVRRRGSSDLPHEVVRRRGSSDPPQAARDIILRRRSALGFDPQHHLALDAFLAMLARTRPASTPMPWDAVDEPPQVHLVLFVHRVEGLVPGIYVSLRDAAARDDLRAAMRADFLWEPVHDLFLLLPTDVTWVAKRLSCDQDIAADGFFSLAMLARFAPLLSGRGDWAYRRLFWECGLIGQVLYLEAEAAGGRGTGIGCFYDDPVHDVLGLAGHGWQSLYHFAMGVPVDDGRLTTEPGYPWERPQTA